MPKTLTMADLMQPEGQLTQYGLCFLAHRYWQKHPDTCQNRLFIVQTCADIKTLHAYLPQDQVIAYIANDVIHKTPILQLGKQFIVLDSKGRDGDYWQLYARDLKAALGRDTKIYFATVARQVDLVSCGTDALSVAKQSLRLGPELFDFVAQQDNFNAPLADGFSVQPPVIAKYSQSISALWRPFPGQKKGLLDYAPELEQTVFSHAKSGGLETLRQYAERHKDGDTNRAIAERREKFRAILAGYVEQQDPDHTLSILTELSGLNILLKDMGMTQTDARGVAASVQDHLENGTVTLADTLGRIVGQQARPQ